MWKCCVELRVNSSLQLLQ